MANQTIVKRQQKEKQFIIENLKRVPIVEAACSKSQVSRATFYRWKLQDKKFAQLADVALSEGASLINDMAESQLISAIKDKNLGAIIFWLRSHHPAYTAKMEITAQLKAQDEKLTPEQEVIVNKALKIAAMTSISKPTKHEDKND